MLQIQTATVDADHMINEVVEKVAEVEDVDPLELSPPLYEVIDPEALNQLFATMSTDGRMEGQVTFPYNGCEVTVCGDASVFIE